MYYEPLPCSLPVCLHCRHRADSRHEIERRIGGLTSFGSGFGASVAASRLCLLHDRFVSPEDGCSKFAALTAA